MIGSFLLSKLWDEDPNQSRGVQSYTTAYHLVPISMVPAKGYGNRVAKHNRQISTRIVWNYISMKSFLEYSYVSFILYATRDYGSRWKNIAWAAKRIFNENSSMNVVNQMMTFLSYSDSKIPRRQWGGSVLTTCLRNFVFVNYDLSQQFCLRERGFLSLILAGSLKTGDMIIG